MSSPYNFKDIIQRVIRADESPEEKRGVKGPNIMEFIDSKWGLNRDGDVQPFPVQRAILKTFYGLPLDDIVKTIEVRDFTGKIKFRLTEAEYLRYLHDEGRCNVSEPIEGGFQDLVLAIGRRSGKTLMASWITAYEADKILLKENPHSYYGIARSDDIKLISVATGKDQAAILYNAVSSHFLKCDRFKPFRANTTKTNAKFQTSADIRESGRYPKSDLARASIDVTFYSSVAKGIRGSGCILAVLDEIAHFVETGQSSAEEVYTAVSPARAAFTPKDPDNPREPLYEGASSEGRIVMISSPLGKEGFFYDMYDKGFRHEDLKILSISAPTWEVNPTIPPEEFKRHFLSDPKKFWTEFGAKFTDRRRGWIDKPSDLESVIDPSAKPVMAGRGNTTYFMGVDVGVTKGGDTTAIAIGHVDEQERIVLDYLHEMAAGEEPYQDMDRLEFDEIANQIHLLSKKFRISEGMLDSWSGIPLEQALAKKGLSQIKSVAIKPELQSKIWKNFKDMMYAERLVFYDTPIPPGDQHCPYITELLELQEEMRSKYVILVQAPQVRGKHDDRSDALARMIWLASQNLGKRGYLAKQRSREEMGYAAVARSERRARARALRGGSHPSRTIPRRRR